MKFISFRYRTKAYRQKKNLDDGITVHVDLIKKRHSLPKILCVYLGKDMI